MESDTNTLCAQSLGTALPQSPPQTGGHEPPLRQPRGTGKVSAERAYKSHFISDFLGIAHAAHFQDVLLDCYFKERRTSLSFLPKEVKNRDLRA